MLRARDTVGVSLADGDGATKEQKATGAASVHMDAKLHGYPADITYDNGKRMSEAGL